MMGSVGIKANVTSEHSTQWWDAAGQRVVPASTRDIIDIYSFRTELLPCDEHLRFEPSKWSNPRCTRRGPRSLLRRYTAMKIALTWPEDSAREPRLDDPAALEMGQTQTSATGLFAGEWNRLTVPA
jgi:hypothetical protein